MIDETTEPPTIPPEPPQDGTLLGDQQVELAELLNTVLDKGVIVHGDVTLAVADVDLVKLNLGLLLSALETVEQTDRAGMANDRPTLANAFGPLSATADRERPLSPSVQSPPPQVSEPSNAAQSASLNAVAHGLPDRINADAPGVESGLARLVLTLIEVLRKVLEHQAVRRMDGGKLSPEEIERLGLALSKLHDRMDELKRVFGLSDEDLQIDLGPLGRLR